MSYNYLRLSLTDKCNFNCFYCQPLLRRRFFSSDEILTAEETLALTKELIACGIRHIRLTGGEPLLRKDIYVLLEGISRLPGLECFSMTTNGFLLNRFLKKAPVCLDKINVSLDTLKKDRFKSMTGSDGFRQVLSGILEAKSRGVKSVKINVVLWRHFNDDEVFDFVDFGARHEIDVRFIEYFSTRSKCEDQRASFVPNGEIRNLIEKVYGPLVPLGKDPLSGPAQYYGLAGQAARIGFISSVTDNFCGECNRLRLSADGKLYVCLHSDCFLDLRTFLKKGALQALPKEIEEVLFEKKKHNKIECQRLFEMSSIGG